MEPRLDSALASSSKDTGPDFDVLTPLLPEEVCWIMDSALAAEVSCVPSYALSIVQLEALRSPGIKGMRFLKPCTPAGISMNFRHFARTCGSAISRAPYLLIAPPN